MQAELLAKLVRVAVELAHRLGLIPLREMHTNEARTRRLAKRLSGDRGHGSRCGVGEALFGGEACGERFQRAQPHLPPALRLEQQPLLAPVREDVGRERPDCA